MLRRESQSWKASEVGTEYSLTMIASDNECSSELSRGKLLAAAGFAAAAASLNGFGEAEAALAVDGSRDPVLTPPVHGLHLQFGADASSEMVVSWHTLQSVRDLGIRQEWLPLFDKYGVDLVVCGHEHHYERSHPIRGRQANAMRRLRRFRRRPQPT
jgi:hypothetical protein